MLELEFHQLELKYAEHRVRDRRRDGQLLASLASEGQQAPVLVVPTESARRYVLVDGYRRVGALQSLGRDTVRALVVSVDETEALCMVLRQQGAPRRSALEQGWLVSELVDGHGLSQAEVGRRLGRSTSWVSRRLALVRDLPPSVQERVRSGQLSAHGAMRHLVPLARANRDDCERLVQGLGTERVSARELGRLYVAWLTSTPQEREALLEAPVLYLKAESAARSSDAAPSAMRALRQDLEVIGAVSRRASRRLQEEIRAPLPLVLDGVWLQTRLAVEQLSEQMEQGLHARSGHAIGGARAEP